MPSSISRPSRRELLRTLSLAGAAGSTLGPLAAAAPRDVTAMRISRFEVLPVRVPFAARLRDAWNSSWKNQRREQTDYTIHFVRLYADNGLVGIGESKMDRPQTEAALKAMVGHTPWEYAQDDSIKGLLIAVYDLIGKATGLPVARLLSPKPKPAIVQTWWSQCFPPDLMASEAKLGASLGYRVNKIKIRPWIDPIAQVQAINAVVPKDFKIWADANAWWGAKNRWGDKSLWATSIDSGLAVIRKLAEFPNLFGIESPVGRDDLNEYRRIKGKITLRVAEHVDNLDPMVFIREKLVDAFITGAPRLGATFTELAAIARVAGVPLWVEHSVDNGISQVFQAHQAAAFPGVEYCIGLAHCLEDDFMEEPFTLENGYYKLPQKPGLGVNLDRAAIDKYRIA